MLDVVAVLVPVLDLLDDGIDALHARRVGRDRQTPRLQSLVGVPLRIGGEADHPSESVTDHAETPLRGHGRVLLAQRARRRVPWIGERGFALFDERRVERLKVLEPEEHLTAHLEQLRDRIFGAAGQGIGYVVDRPSIERDVLAGPPVTSGRTAHESSVLVHQVQRHTVDLDFAQVVQIRTGLGLDPLGPRTELVVIEHVVQAQHSFQMVDGGELRRETTAHELGR
ncbi:unannotated protein [freshwater metagenome]|uniref:Unannotated protein n=1 Tax=freshwater metagenome TaxID=449393 RepID=A0A6J7J441_9ZZZZ